MVRAVRGTAVACALLATAACGQKGAPLAPLVRIPAAIDEIAARRIGNDVYVTLTVPTRNIDGATPATVERIEIFGYTGRSAPPRARWTELGALVASVPVQPPPPSEDGAAGAPADTPPPGAVQGTAVTIRDTLSIDELGTPPATAAALTAPVTAAAPDPAAPALVAGASPAPAQAPLRRYYMAIGFGPRGRPGPPGASAELPLEPLPDAPTAVRARFTETAVIVEWDPPAGAPAAAPVAAALPKTEPVQASGPVPVQYRVYREDVPESAEPSEPATSWQQPVPMPLNAEPVDALTFADDVVFGRQRCYSVRAVAGTGARAVESLAPPAVCVTPIDIFPPPTPAAPATVAAAGVITILWEASQAPDLAGYLVLRGEAGDDTLRPLTPMPIAETSYRDTAVTPGARYVYAVVAVDNRQPVSNASEPSARVEETAR